MAQEHKELKGRAMNALKKSKAWVLVTWDGEHMPVIGYDLHRCQNKEDIRHLALQNMCGATLQVRDSMLKLLEKINEKPGNAGDGKENICDPAQGTPDPRPDMESRGENEITRPSGTLLDRNGQPIT